MKLRAAIFAVLLCCAFSCADDTNLNKTVDPILNQLLRTDAFNQLLVPLSDLDLENPVHQKWEKGEVIILRFTDEKHKYIFGFATRAGNEVRFKSVIIGEYHTSATPEQLNEDLRSGTFTGSFTMTSSLRQIKIDVGNGKFINNKILSESPNAKAACGLVDAGRCAATRIDAMNWLDYTVCVVDIAVCWPIMVASCYIDDCVAFPEVA